MACKLAAPLMKLTAEKMANELAKITTKAVNDLGEKSRCIQCTIYNGTNKTFVYDHNYCDSGHAFKSCPPRIPPQTKITFPVYKKFGGFGVKGTVVYRVEHCNHKVVFYFCNPFSGRNEIGVQSDWNSNNSRHWYYCNVPSDCAGTMHKKKQHTLTFFYNMSGGNSSAALWVIRGHLGPKPKK